MPHAGLVAASLAEAARGVPPGPLPRIVSRLLRHPGKADVTAALAALRANRAVNADEPAGQPVARLQLGASLDLLSLAGTILERQANAVTEERLVVWQTDEIVDGLADRSSIRMAADLVSLALCGASRLSVARIGECAKEAGGGGASAGRAMAASFLAELEARALPAAFRPDEAGEAAPSDVPRLLPLAGTAALIVAIDAVSAARALDRARPEPLGAPLDAVRRLVRERVPAGTGADFGLTDLAAAADLVRSGALADAAGLEMPLAGGEIDRLRPRSR